MKSKLNDAGLIAEAYLQISPKLSAEEIKANQLKKIDTIIDGAVNSDQEVTEEMLGALAGGIGAAARGVGAAARGARTALKKVATSDTTKKIVRGAGNLAADVAKEAGIVAAEVGGEGLKAAGQAVGSLADKAIDAADKGISKLAAETAEDGENMPHVNHHDDSEMKMALAELYKIEKYAFALSLMMKDLPALEGWTAAKITKAADYLGSVFHKLDYDFASGEHASMFNVGHEDINDCGCGAEAGECSCN